MDREEKKALLKKRVINFDELTFADQKNIKPKKNKNKKNVLIICVAIIILFVFLFFLLIRKYNNKNILFTKNISEINGEYTNTNIKYIGFGNGLIRYSSDGASYIDKNGSTKWSVTYNISKPYVYIRGEYALIADIGGTKLYTFTKQGKLSNIQSNNIINKITMSKNGDIVILSNGEEEDYIYVYDKTGNTGDIYIKYVRAESGVPTDLSISDDSKLLIVSLSKIDDGKILSYVNFYNFDEDVLVSNDKRIIKTVNDYYKDKIISKTEFLDEKNVVCFYDGGITFFNIENENMKIKNINIDTIIRSAYIENENVYLVIENEENKKNKYKLIKYNKNGKVVSKKDFNKEYISFYVTNGCSMFIGLDDLMIIDNVGIVRYDGKFIDEFLYIKNEQDFLFMDLIVGLSNSIKRMWIY